MAHNISDLRPADATERALRVELAAAYRMADFLGWRELIFNHITLRVPGPERHFLINPYGLWYDEVTASNLVKIDLDGNIIGASEWPVNPAGFIIHSAIHAASDTAHCVVHTHTTAGMAIACQEGGLGMNSIYSAPMKGQIAYHDFEGITLFDDEKERLVANLGSQKHMILRNHGLLTVGETVAEAMMRMWRLNRACEVQHAASNGGQAVIPLSEEACERSLEAQAISDRQRPHGARVFQAWLRKVEKLDPSYKD